MGKCAHLHFLLSYTIGLVYWLAGWLAGVGWCWRLSYSRKLMVIIVLGRNANKQEQKRHAPIGVEKTTEEEDCGASSSIPRLDKWH